MKLALQVLLMAKQLPVAEQADQKNIIVAAFREVYNSSLPNEEFHKVMEGVARSPNPFNEDGYTYMTAHGGDTRLRDSAFKTMAEHRVDEAKVNRASELHIHAGSPKRTASLG